MLFNKKIVAVLPAYNAAKTLAKTVADIPKEIDAILLVDDGSIDNTVQIAQDLGLSTYVLINRMGYGYNQKRCYSLALDMGADVVVMIHPDYQYDPRLALSLAGMVASGVYDAAIGSRIIGGGALKGGMPVYKYVANRALTLAQNLLMGCKFSEYHTGYRAYSRRVLEFLPVWVFDNGFLFDNQILCKIVSRGYRVGEISCPTRYDSDSSSISFWPSVKYGLGVLWTAWKCRRTL